MWNSIVLDPAVHPHGRGDNDGDTAITPRRNGSPPRAWGQFPSPLSFGNAIRFTPTGVGTMTRSRAAIGRRLVHPHGRGDNGSAVEIEEGDNGSPPRAWGQSPPRPCLCVGGRFTPTGVGTIQSCVAIHSRLAVHPHGRGDNDRARRGCHNTFGSPPRAWGQCAYRPAR